MKQTILHENSHGIRMIRKDYVRRSEVKVKGSNDYTIATYRFPNIPDTFASPFISWANLDCCNGWQYDRDYLESAVPEGRKLYAGLFGAPKNNVPEGLIVGEEVQGPAGNWFICRNGKLSDYYDIKAVIDHYAKLGVVFCDKEYAEIHNLSETEIQDFGTDKAPYNYAWSNSAAQLVITGLLLGYPLESTASLLGA